MAPDSALAFKKKIKLGQFSEQNREGAEEGEKKMADAIAVGTRCKVTVGETSPKIGTVMFVGKYDMYNYTYL